MKLFGNDLMKVLHGSDLIPVQPTARVSCANTKLNAGYSYMRGMMARIVGDRTPKGTPKGTPRGKRLRKSNTAPSKDDTMSKHWQPQEERVDDGVQDMRPIQTAEDSGISTTMNLETVASGSPDAAKDIEDPDGLVHVLESLKGLHDFKCADTTLRDTDVKDSALWRMYDSWYSTKRVDVPTSSAFMPAPTVAPSSVGGMAATRAPAREKQPGQMFTGNGSRQNVSLMAVVEEELSSYSSVQVTPRSQRSQVGSLY
jgi:hypothetical protein